MIIKRPLIAVLLLSSLLLLVGCTHKEPALVPELFGAHQTGDEDNRHSALTFSPDGSELFYSVYVNNQRPQKIYFTKLVNGTWSESSITSFSGTYDLYFNRDYAGPRRVLFKTSQAGNYFNPAEPIKELTDREKIFEPVPIEGEDFFIYAKNYLEEIEFPQLTGPYLGQSPPGMTPEIFASGILVAKDGDAINSVFSPDGREFYYVVLEDGSPRYNLWFTEIGDGIWAKPSELRLAGEYEAADIALSPDGNRLYFCSDMPTFWEDAEGFDIWYVERDGNGWSKPINAGRNINSPRGETQPSFTSDGTMYFPSLRKGSRNESVDLFFSEMINGEFMEPVRLPDSVNSEYNEGNSFVAPDGSFILFARWDMPESIDGGKGLYISFREPDSGWTEAVNAAPVLAVRGSLAALTHDSKYLLWSTPQGIHWVDVRALEQLKPGH